MTDPTRLDPYSQRTIERLERSVSGVGRVAMCHIPKTAGSTAIQAFKDSPLRERTLPAYSPDLIAQTESLTPDDLDALTFVSGHFHFSDLRDMVGPDTPVFAFVREPVARMISYYRFAARSDIQNPVAEAARTMNFTDFCARLRSSHKSIIMNQQTRYLLGDRVAAGRTAVRFTPTIFDDPQLHVLPHTSCGDVLDALGRALDVDLTPKRAMKVSPDGDKITPSASERDQLVGDSDQDQLLVNHIEALRRGEQPPELPRIGLGARVRSVIRRG